MTTPSSNDRTTSLPVLTFATPQLFVGDLLAFCEFFTGKPGFAVDFAYGEPVFYRQLGREGARLSFRHTHAR